MTFHNYYHIVSYFAAVISILGAIVMLFWPDLLSGIAGTGIQWIDFTYFLVSGIVIIIMLTGMEERETYAWICVFIRHIIDIVYLFVPMVLCIMLGVDVSSIGGSFLGGTLVSVLIMIYYYRRKPMFIRHNTLDTTVQEKQEIIEKETVDIEEDLPNTPDDTKEEADMLFCRKCGTRIPPDSVFCTKCGEKVVF